MTGWRAFRLSEVGCLTLVTNKHKIQLVMVSSFAPSFFAFFLRPLLTFYFFFHLFCDTAARELDSLVYARHLTVVL